MDHGERASVDIARLAEQRQRRLEVAGVYRSPTFQFGDDLLQALDLVVERLSRFRFRFVDFGLRLLAVLGLGLRLHAGFLLGFLFLGQFLLETRQRRVPLLDVASTEMSHAQQPSMGLLAVGLATRFEIRRVGRGDQLIPELEQGQRVREPLAAERRAAAFHRVVPRMPRQLAHIPRQIDPRADLAHMHEVANEPLVVVREVVDLIGHHAVAHHVGVIDPRRRLLLPSAVVVTLQSRKNVAAHVPHVGDARTGLAAQSRRPERLVGLLVVPQVDAVVVRRMHRIGGENLAQ